MLRLLDRSDWFNIILLTSTFSILYDTIGPVFRSFCKFSRWVIPWGLKECPSCNGYLKRGNDRAV